jgi:Na+-transporting NADH:ubiquinone oxidoreductase subunit E
MLTLLLLTQDPNSAGALLNLALRQIFVENILLAYFLGMCSYLAVSKKVESSIGLGIAVVFVQTLTVPLNWALVNYVLKPGALAWAGLPDADLGYLKFLCFIATIAATVQVVEMAIDKWSPKLYASLGIFLPLIAVNCAILGGSLFMDQNNYTFPQAVVYGVSSGAGWAVAIVSMATIRWKLRTANVPAPLRGLGITFITTGLVATAFMTFSGI